MGLERRILVGLLIVCVSQTVFGQILPESLEGGATTCGFLRKYGYDCEIHEVQTFDGYILNLFRVLCPKANVTTTSPRPVAFLMHGLLASSTTWVITPETGLGMTMCDNGYDVWLGNARGNQFSNKHKIYHPQGGLFYKFSWSEIASIDVPAMLNYTLYTTKQKNLRYVGHSQGTTVFFAFASENPKLAASWISSAHLLSPVVFMTHMKGAIEIPLPLLGRTHMLGDAVETVLMPKSLVSDVLGNVVCGDLDMTNLCKTVFNMLFGKSDRMNTSVYNDVLTTVPAGSSLRQLKHYAQEKRSAKFAKYDYGWRNYEKYHTFSPPEYPLKDITVPTFLYYTDSDYLSAVEDVERLIRTLSPKTLRAAHFIPGYNHLDYLIADNVKQDLHALILKDIQSLNTNNDKKQ